MIKHIFYDVGGEHNGPLASSSRSSAQKRLCYSLTLKSTTEGTEQHQVHYRTLISMQRLSVLHQFPCLMNVNIQAVFNVCVYEVSEYVTPTFHCCDLFLFSLSQRQHAVVCP